MKKLLTVFIMTLICLGIFSGCGGSKEPEIKIGNKAPDFEFSLVNGKTSKLSDFQDKIVLLNFWSTKCPPCVGEMPAFEKLHNDYHDDLVILAINCGESQKTVQKFINDNGYTFTFGIIEKVESISYPTSAIPYTVIINKEGKIVYTQVGAADADTMYKKYKPEIEKSLSPH